MQPSAWRTTHARDAQVLPRGASEPEEPAPERRLWRFSAPKADVLRYYRTLVTAYRANPAHTTGLIDELDRTVTEMEGLAAEGDRSLGGT